MSFYSYSSESSNRFFIGTSFPKIGLPDYPMVHEELESALSTARQIRDKGYNVKVYFQKVITTEDLLVDW